MRTTGLQYFKLVYCKYPSFVVKSGKRIIYGVMTLARERVNAKSKSGLSLKSNSNEIGGQVIVNPIKQLPRVIKTSRVEMRQLDVTRENAEMIFDAIKDENPSDFYFNPIGVDNIVPKSADEVLKFMQRESGWTADNGVALYLFQNNKFIGYRRLFF